MCAEQNVSMAKGTSKGTSAGPDYVMSSETLGIDGCESSTPREISHTPTGAPTLYKTDPFTIEQYKLKVLLQSAVKDMSVARFVELRRQFDKVRPEVLDEL